MPRGRAGQCYVTAESIRRVLDVPGRYERIRRAGLAADFFGVDIRTVRRWRSRGLTLFYFHGERSLHPETWEAFAARFGIEVKLERRGQFFIDPAARVRAPAHGQVSINTCPSIAGSAGRYHRNKKGARHA